MDALLYFLLWGAVIFFMMRMGCGSHVMGHGHGHGHSHGQKEQGGDKQAPQALKWYPPETDTDPVCKKTVRTEGAKSSVFDGSVYYFCSRECRELFEAKPELYVAPATPESPPKLEAHNV